MQTKATHTPGPWIAETFALRPDSLEADCGIVSKGGYSVCRCPRYQKQKRWAADAALICAAPDLLEACKAALDFLEHRRDDLKHLGE